jgi:hypothetical protein
MKKSLIIVISLVAVFFFASTNQAMAQWSVDVYWVDTDCSCTFITSKTIEWEIRKISDNSLISSGVEDVTTNITNFEELTGSEIIYDDTFYRVCVRVNYYTDAAIVTLCCTGTTCDANVDGENLLSGDYGIIVYME